MLRQASILQRITEEELELQPFTRQRSASHDANMNTYLSHSKSSDELRARSARLKTQVARVQAIKEAVESSEESEFSSRE